MRESQRKLIEKRMALGQFKKKHREQEIKNIKIEIKKKDNNNCFIFKKNGKDVDKICITRS